MLRGGMEVPVRLRQLLVRIERTFATGKRHVMRLRSRKASTDQTKKEAHPCSIVA